MWSLYGQSLNMILEDTWNGATGEEYSDIWGYAAPNGTEVAIIGSDSSIHFIDVTTPSNVQVIASFDVINLSDSSASRSIWRDFKTYGTYAYACADEGVTSSGLIIFDLSNVPTSVTLVNQTNAFFNRSHNIFIDQAHGRLYAAGSNTRNNGVLVLDIGTDPVNPVLIGDPVLILGYIHDIYVRDNIGYCSHGNDHTLTIYDFTDADNPVWIKDIDGYPEAGYNHSSWLDASGSRLIFADETHGMSVKLVDPTLSNIQTTDFHTFKSQLLPNDDNSIAHNPFILGDLVFLSYYHDGVQVFDISNVNNIVNVAYYDTYSNNTYSGYHGCWGVYPYLPSGRIIASDIESGLFVLTMTGGVLPLDFLDFKVEQKGSDVEILWKVSAPEDGDLFFVEHSRDGVVFESLVSIAADRNTLYYSMTDGDLKPGTHFYRIRSVLVDGAEKFTGIRSLRIGGQQTLEVYPTLVRDRAYVNAFAPGNVTVYDATGRVIDQWNTTGEEQHQLETGSLPPGTYYVQLAEPGGSTNCVPLTKIQSR